MKQVSDFHSWFSSPFYYFFVFLGAGLDFLLPRRLNPLPESKLHSIVRVMFSLVAHVWEPACSVQICSSRCRSSLWSRSARAQSHFGRRRWKPGQVPFFLCEAQSVSSLFFSPSGAGQVFALPLPVFTRENLFTARSLCSVLAQFHPPALSRCCPCDFGLPPSICFSY
jgi:hypothetical protein